MSKSLGLTSKEAAGLLATHGPNEIVQKSKNTPLSMFIGQFRSPLVIILLFATILSLALGDELEGILILLIVLLNAFLGFVQEFRAEKALEALKSMTVSIVRVIRDNKDREIDSKLLVPGDVISLEEGNKIPADCRIIQCLHFEVDEASLTGESLPVEKSTEDESGRLIFLGTTVVRGRATALILATGMGTKFGAIAERISTMQKEETPLERKLAGVAKQIGLAALVAGAVISTIGYYHQIPMVTILLTAISLAVAAVPEGLPAVITITLAIGTQRMAKKKAILRKLTAIEALGGITVIATDKTGTLTRNEMRVTQIWCDNRVFSSKGLPTVNTTLLHLITTGILCNNASLAPKEGPGDYDIIGDKTEGALLLLGEHHNLPYTEIKESGTLVEEFAFDATTKTMSVIWKKSGGTFVYTKGAPEIILSKSTRILTSSGERELSQKEKSAIIDEFEKFAKEGLRTIALATRKITWDNQKRHLVESDLTFLGFVGISDPPRPEVKSAIDIARQAGIKTIMITGDNELTAHAIAKQIGLMEKGDEIITGTQFASLTAPAKNEKLEHIRVFARTSPEQKFEIVQLLQKAGHIVAATGDGVNDALALKQANVGIAMGITGTDVAKEAADMVITDDNYATIVTAVEEGRIIYDNMKSSIKYLLGGNIGEIIALVGGALLGWPFILLPIQILYINLITDGLPAVALALNTKHHNIMSRRPRTEKSLFTGHDIRWFAEVSTLTAATTLTAFAFGHVTGNLPLARTLAFMVLALAQQYIFLDIIAGDRTIFSPHVFANKWVIIPLGLMLVQVFIARTHLFQSVFQIYAPQVTPFLIAGGICTIMVVVSELRKRYLHHWYYAHTP